MLHETQWFLTISFLLTATVIDLQVERAGLDPAAQATPQALPTAEVGDTFVTGKEFLQPDEQCRPKPSLSLSELKQESFQTTFLAATAVQALPCQEEGVTQRCVAKVIKPIAIIIYPCSCI